MIVDPTVQVALVGVAGTLAAAVLESIRRNTKATREHASAAREQVQNSHSTNLRDDLDRVLGSLDLVLENQKTQGEDLRQLRTDLAQERRERLAVADRVDDLAELIH